MKRFSKLLCFMVVFIAVMAAFCTVSFASSIGEQIGEGWQRIDNTSSSIIFNGSHEITAYSNYYGGSAMRIAPNNMAGSAEFKFYGSKFRIFSATHNPGFSTNVQVKVDGEVIGTYNSSGSLNYNVILFTKTSLPVGLHTVFITPLDTTQYGTIIDAIDIDATGYLIDINVPNSPTNLTAAPGNTKVNLSWNAVEAATNYNVKRSETPGGPYQKIATTTTGAITYSDTGLQNGTTYYYVVSAVNAGGESPDSIEVSATPTAPQPTNQLKLVLEVNQEKQLSVSDELSDNTEMDWVSSDPSIATVDSNGKVKALKPGNTVITCISKDKSYTEPINVLVVDLEYQLAVDLNIGGTCRLTIDDLTNTTYVTWASYDPTIATVSSKGKVAAVSEGVTYITAIDKDGTEIGRIYIRVRQ